MYCYVNLYRRKALSMAKISDERKEKKDAGPSINYRVWVSRHPGFWVRDKYDNNGPMSKMGNYGSF